MQKLSPDAYAALALPDQWIEDCMQEVEARWIVEQTRDCQRILDLGWGSGIVARALKAAGRRIVVVDGAPQSAKEAEDAGCCGIHAMFEDFDPCAPFDSYDCVIASFVLEHVADPVVLLKRMRAWAPKLIAVVGNAESWHRRLAVKMGLQAELSTLSARDHAVGHYVVFSRGTIADALSAAGWRIIREKGIMLKPLPNSMMAHFDERLIRAMCEAEIAPREAANFGIVCERL